MLRLSLVALVALVTIPGIGADKLDRALSSAIFPPTSPLCSKAGSSTSFSTKYSTTTAISKWDTINAAYEVAVFEIDMIHSDSNKNRSWTLRLGLAARSRP
jgi:hypothetical protein